MEAYFPMKPKLKVIFPDYNGDNKIEVEKIKISRNHRRMELILNENIDDDIIDNFEEKIRSKYHLTSMNILTKDETIAKPEEIFAMPVISSSDSENSPKKIITLGKPIIDEMLYGRSIRDDLVPISSINENSDRVCFMGEIFGVEYKEIKSKKTEKEFHLFVIDVTDYNDSISAQVFINKDDKNEPVFKTLKDKLKKGAYVVIRGKAQYNEFAREVVVSANGIATTWGPAKK